MQKVVAAVHAVREAKKRIGFDTSKTFYSVNDIWHYIALADDRTCPVCMGKDGNEYNGAYLRTGFPYHVVDNDDTVRANTHINCRCILLRSSLFFSLPALDEH